MLATSANAQRVASVGALVTTVVEGKNGAVIELAAGTFKLTQPLELKTGMTLKGTGIGKTIITHAEGWQANPATLPDPETNHEKFDRTGYLIRCANDAKDITVSHLTLTGPQMHGAISGFGNEGLDFHDLRIQDFLYSGIRTYAMKRVKIHDCTFVDAGQRWDNGKPGVKGREARRVHIHHNTIEAGFSIELPFEGDEQPQSRSISTPPLCPPKLCPERQPGDSVRRL